jgi:thiamine biosynthesis protein ThiS
VTVTVNGRPEEAVPGETVESLLDRLGLAAQYALVERNGEPVERARYGDTAREEGVTLVVARTDEEADEVGKKGRRQARRGRRPKLVQPS